MDGDVTSDVVDSYMMRIAWMLREMELMTLSGVHLYRLYRFTAERSHVLTCQMVANHRALYSCHNIFIW